RASYFRVWIGRGARCDRECSGLVNCGGIPKESISMRVLKYALLVVTASLLPSLAMAQGTLTGTVRDNSGAVLPGVTVEAASPAIQRVLRTVVIDGDGR